MSFFGKRLTADLDVVHSCDPALDGVDSTVLERYLLTRDISVLPASVLASASILTCRPLDTKSEHLITLAHEPQAMRAIFRSHVCAARGPAAIDLQFETAGNRRQLTEQSAESVTIDFVAEIVAVIVQSASKRGDAAPFSPPDTWRASRRLTARAKVLAALTEPLEKDAPTSAPVKVTGTECG
jgi:hypothetical protein